MAQDEACSPSPNSSLTETNYKVEDKPAAGSALARPKTEEARIAARGKKVVRFQLREDEISGGGGGVLRIKVVVSQKELKQILKDRESNSSTLEELLAELKMKGRTISDARADKEEDENGSWRPALESIPEDLH